MALADAERVAAERGPSRSDGGTATLGGPGDWEERTEAAYAAVLAAARRRTRTPESALGGAVALVALVAAVVLVPDPAPPRPSRPRARCRGPRSTASGGDRLRYPGRRRRQPLRGAGLAEYADYAATFPSGRFRIRLSVSAERSVLTVAGDQRSIGILRLEGHRVSLEPLPPNMGFSYFRWSREGRQVSLAFTGSSMAKHSGYPAEVHQVALYATAPFTRY